MPPFACLRALPLSVTASLALALPGLADPVIRGVTLSTAGLAMIEATGPIGPTPLRLSVARAQIDDFLKSLWVLDSAEAPLQIALPGPGALEDAFARLPIGPADATEPARLLAAMIGAPLRVERRGEVWTGTLMGVSTRACEHGPCSVLNLLTADGQARAFELGDALGFAFTDPADQVVLTRALAALRATTQTGAVAVEIQSQDTSPRDIGLVYLQDAPLWRTAWRAVDTPEGVQLVGWAIVENTTGADWQDVRLTLATGSLRAIRARLYDRARAAREDMAPAPMMLAAAPMARAMTMADGLAEMAPAPIEADDGDSFSRFTLTQPVTLAAGQMISLPFLSETLPDARLTLVRGGMGETHPQIALDLVNPLPLRLPAGVLTLYEDGRGHAGDAHIPELAPGGRALVPFARDTAMRVVEEASMTETVREMRLARGVLQVSEDLVRTTTYRIEGAPGADRVVTLDHPRHGGWDLDTLGAIETMDAWRWQVSVAAGAQVTHVVTERQPRMRRVVLADLDTATLAAWTGRVTDGALAATLARFAALRAEITTAETALRDAETRQRALESEQARLVNLIVQLGDDSAANRDRRARVDAVDGEITALSAQRDTLRAQIAERRAMIDALVAG